jgi:UrcA family protein
MIGNALAPGRRAALALSLAVAGLASTVSAVRADPFDTAAGITVRAPHPYVRQPVTGAMVRLDQVSYVVSLSDLNLSTRRGAVLAKARIERAAKDVCQDVQDRYGTDEEVAGGCYVAAVRDALIQTERLSGYPIVAWGYR